MLESEDINILVTSIKSTSKMYKELLEDVQKLTSSQNYFLFGQCFFSLLYSNLLVLKERLNTYYLLYKIYDESKTQLNPYYSYFFSVLHNSHNKIELSFLVDLLFNSNTYDLKSLSSEEYISKHTILEEDIQIPSYSSIETQFNSLHPLPPLLRSIGVTSSFDIYTSLYKYSYTNQEIPMISISVDKMKFLLVSHTFSLLHIEPDSISVLPSLYPLEKQEMSYFFPSISPCIPMLTTYSPDTSEHAELYYLLKKSVTKPLNEDELQIIFQQSLNLYEYFEKICNDTIHEQYSIYNESESTSVLRTTTSEVDDTTSKSISSNTVINRSNDNFDPIYSDIVIPSLISNNSMLAISYLYYRLQHDSNVKLLLDLLLTIPMSAEYFVVIQQLSLLYSFPLQFYRSFILYCHKTINSIKDKTLFNKLLKYYANYILFLLNNNMVNLRSIEDEMKTFCTKNKANTSISSLYKQLF